MILKIDVALFIYNTGLGAGRDGRGVTAIPYSCHIVSPLNKQSVHQYPPFTNRFR